jgi:Rieske 2Fe-2S protein
MPIQKVSEIEGEPEVGKHYLVLCVQHRLSEQWIPVVGVPHDDKEYIGVPDVHYHHDVRFMSESRIEELSNTQVERPTGAAYAMVRIVLTANLVGKPVYKRRKCRRTMPSFPTELRCKHNPLFPSRAQWFPELEAAYKDTTLSSCLRCPHRGMSLKNLPKDGQGNVVCNGHGLKWNADTGKLVSRL